MTWDDVREREGLPPRVSQWEGCYDAGWQDCIVPEAFSHPAKFSKGLIHRIYQHAKEKQWMSTGDYILDPFGGVALGALDAMSMGLNWIGVELEKKFVDLGQQNIELWTRQLKGWPNLGTARIVQGDSRTPGNLANMKEGNIALVCGSPPYADQSIQKNSGSIDREKQYETYRSHGGGASFELFCKTQEFHSGHYGTSPGQLGSMKEGSFDMCVSSPPFEDQAKFQDNRSSIRKDPKFKAGKSTFTDYGSSPFNLGNSSGPTFWEASMDIVHGCFSLLRPGGHAIWVCKDYVKKGQRVPFSDRWLSLCQSIGFVLCCRHHAMLVDNYGAQMNIQGDMEEVTVERKSFFRRLAEKKGSPRIDWEDVICLVKP